MSRPGVFDLYPAPDPAATSPANAVMTDLSALCERLRAERDIVRDMAESCPRDEPEAREDWHRLWGVLADAASALERLSAELEQAKRERDEALAAIDAVATRGPGMTLVEAVKGVLGILAGTETELAEAESAMAQMRKERDEAAQLSHQYRNEYERLAKLVLSTATVETPKSLIGAAERALGLPGVTR